MTKPSPNALAKANSAARLGALDNLRGLIMVIMALDHVSLFIGHRHSSEFFRGPLSSYKSPLLFLTRFVTHLCAPGFFFLMGVGMALFAASRRAQRWPESKISLYFLKRGALLIAVNLILENRAWHLGTAFQIHEGGGGGGLPAWFIFTVLSGLGMSMIGGALLLQLRGLVGWAAVLLVLLCNAIVPTLTAESYPIWMRLLLIPGFAPGVMVLYPVLPWLGVTGLGIALGRFFAPDESGNSAAEKSWRVLPFLGLALVATSLFVHYTNNFGNLRLPRDGSLIEFLNFIKYPPALTFVTFMLGTNLVLLSLLRGKLPILRTFGQAPLCFYIAHLFLYAGLGALFFRREPPLYAMYVVWPLGLVPLYFLCRWFRAFKDTKQPDSLWRLF